MDRFSETQNNSEIAFPLHGRIILIKVALVFNLSEITTATLAELEKSKPLLKL